MMSETISGYVHPGYAAALAEHGTPFLLGASGGWILVSPIENTTEFDARGCYPLFCCRSWERLREDLESLKGALVSLTLVTDPMGDYTPGELSECFPDLCRAYKEHFVVDLSVPLDRFVAKTHARYARKASHDVRVAIAEEPLLLLDAWVGLYANLVARHGIQGIGAFSRESFAQQLQVPGLVAFAALHGGETVGMILFYVKGERAYYHLAAYSDRGYELRASYALFATALGYFAARLRWVNLGAGAGIVGDANDGLSRFKRGWSTGARPAYLCGRIFDRYLYDEISRSRHATVNGYFPLYREALTS